MPNRNSQGSPRLVYRIDSRPPEEIFLEGFTPWGNNINFFQHILGYSLGDDIPEEERSGIISTSDSPDSSLRFFGGLLSNPQEELTYYLYEIRADENVYSAQRTASYYNYRINNNLMIFNSERELNIALEAIDSIYTDFAYQREWFNIGVIPRERIRSAWRVDSIPINPNHIRHQRDTVYFTPRINEPEIFNSNYVDAETFANDLPFTNDQPSQTPVHVSIPNEISEADSTGGVRSSLGFACTFFHDSSTKSKRSIDNNLSLKCYFDSKFVHKHLENKSSISPIIFSSVYKSKLFLIGSITHQEFFITNDIFNKSKFMKLVNINKKHNLTEFIYNSFNCFVFEDENYEFEFAITMQRTEFVDIYKIVFEIATTNDFSQKFRLEKVNTNNDVSLFRINSIWINNYSIHRNIHTNEIVARKYDDKNDNFEELYIVIGNNRCDTCILLPQNSKTKLVDLQLSWYYKKQNYVPIPETGYSKPSLPIINRFFYDLNTYKIIYIDSNKKVFGLYNNRKNNQQWNWVRWVPTDLIKTNDKRLKWYFQIQKWTDNIDEINFRNIRSFLSNEYLRVVIYGANWGYFYTTKSINDINSLAVFRINLDADV